MLTNYFMRYLQGTATYNTYKDTQKARVRPTCIHILYIKRKSKGTLEELHTDGATYW